MRNQTKGTTPRHPTRTAPPNAFSQAFLLKAARLEDLPSSAPTQLTTGGFWAGPWEVEQIDVSHDLLWAVVRRGEPVAAGSPAVAVTRHRSDAILLAASLPALAVPNHLRLGEKGKRLGFPIHDGSLCVGHLSRPRAPDHRPASHSAHAHAPPRGPGLRRRVPRQRRPPHLRPCPHASDRGGIAP